MRTIQEVINETEKQNIDESLTKIDVQTLETKIEQIKLKGQQKRAEKTRNQELLETFGDIDYNENTYQEILSEDKANAVRLNTALSEYSRVSKEIEALKQGEFCPTCGSKLKNVDNTNAIALSRYDEDVLIDEVKIPAFPQAVSMLDAILEKVKAKSYRQTF